MHIYFYMTFIFLYKKKVKVEGFQAGTTELMNFISWTE